MASEGNGTPPNGRKYYDKNDKSIEYDFFDSMMYRPLAIEIIILSIGILAVLGTKLKFLILAVFW